MISWMQKHNKYLVWTIWVATIAFIGAGFVGWGSYNFRTGAGAIAKVGDVEIKQSKLNMIYNNLYSRYSELYKGNFDDAKAKELGLIKQAFSTVETQAKLLNYAKELGIIVSDEELAQALAQIKAFQKDGKFDKAIYKAYLQNHRLQAKTFENAYRDDLVIAKLRKLHQIDPLPFEVETIEAAFGATDKVVYEIVTQDEVTLNNDEEAIKKYWESNKERYMTPRSYKVEIVWTSTAETNVTDEELKNFYETNSFNYVDASEKQLNFEEAKAQVTKDLKLKKSKKQAQRDYIALKKGTLQTTQTVTLNENDRQLSQPLWSEIKTAQEGSIIKPKVVNDKYASVKLIAIIEPRTMTFAEAKPFVTRDYTKEAKEDALMKLAKSKLSTLEENNETSQALVSLSQQSVVKGLNPQESLQFTQKLFTSLKEKGIIVLANKVVVYKIVDQTYSSLNPQTKTLAASTATSQKERVFTSNLINILDKKYPTEVYRGGLR